MLISVVYPFKINSVVGFFYLINVVSISFYILFFNTDTLPSSKLKILKALMLTMPVLGICYAIVVVTTLPDQLPTAVVLALAINIFVVILSFNLIYHWKKYGFEYVINQIQRLFNAEATKKKRKYNKNLDDLVE